MLFKCFCISILKLNICLKLSFFKVESFCDISKPASYLKAHVLFLALNFKQHVIYFNLTACTKRINVIRQNVSHVSFLFFSVRDDNQMILVKFFFSYKHCWSLSVIYIHVRVHGHVCHLNIMIAKGCLMNFYNNTHLRQQ